MNILGISCHYHDAAASLIKDGIITAAAEEERFTRIKHDSEFPYNSIQYCLKEGNINITDIDAIVYYEKPLLKFERLLETYLHSAPIGIKSFIKAIAVWIKKKLWISVEIRKKLNYKGDIYYSTHHLSHAASAFYPSYFDEAAIITADGVGEWTTTSIAKGKDNNITILKEILFPHSIGLLYSAFTYYTGFKVNSGEYKLMGLAPYGKGKYTKLILEYLIDLKEDGSFRLNMEYFNYMSGLTMTSQKFHMLFDGPPRKPESKITQKEMDIAKSIQEVTEIVMEKIVKHAMEITKCDKICLAGGVALNCVANGKLLKKLPIKDIFIQPSSGDAGASLGAALLGWYFIFNNERKIKNSNDSQNGSLLGPSFSNDDIKLLIENENIPYKKLENFEKFHYIAKLISEGNVVCVFQGRMEFGPRALGGRSILGDARNPNMQKKMNLKIKYRESFRPFAPIVLEEDCNEIFDIRFKSPYMLLVADILEKHRISLSLEQNKYFGIDKLNIPRSHLPAITHVDYSARLQTINKESNPFCYNLLKAFKEITGISVMINTSFNVRGEPIVLSPKDAYVCFKRTEADYLLLENYLIKKSEINNNEINTSWKNEYTLD